MTVGMISFTATNADISIMFLSCFIQSVCFKQRYKMTRKCYFFVAFSEHIQLASIWKYHKVYIFWKYTEMRIAWIWKQLSLYFILGERSILLQKTMNVHNSVLQAKCKPTYTCNHKLHRYIILNSIEIYEDMYYVLQHSTLCAKLLCKYWLCSLYCEINDTYIKHGSN